MNGNIRDSQMIRHPEYITKKPMTPLLRSAIVGGVEATVSRRIQEGDDLEGRNRDGLTPLMLAARHDKPGIIKLLLKAGAKPGQLDPSGRNALFHAEQAGATACVALLQEALAIPAATPADTPEQQAGSSTAALLNDRIRSAVRPDPVARCLTPFTPWNAPVLLDPPRVPEALGAVELELLGQINTASALVLHIGRSCSPWTNEVRARFPRLPVHETDGEMPLDQLRGGLPLPHLAYVRVESASRLPRVLQDAEQTLGCARIDCIEFTLRGESVGREVARVLEMGYRLLSVEAEGMRWLPEGRMRQPGKYLLMHERLLHAPPEAGQPLIDLRAEAGRHGVVLAGRGVLHVGAHEGREMPYYQTLGMEPIVLVEANPAVYQRLVQGVGGQPGVMTVQRAISDRAGQVELHLASFDQSSSLLPMDKHAEVYPDIRPAGTISVEASRLDDLVTELGLHPRQFALLHIDVQGAERLVLSGTEAVLGAVEAVSIEVNFAELYRSCAQIEVIEYLLGSHGFRRVALMSPYHPSWGDALYLRRV